MSKLEDDNPWAIDASPTIDLDPGSNVWASSDDEQDHVVADPDLDHDVNAPIHANFDHTSVEVDSDNREELSQEESDHQNTVVHSNPWGSIIDTKDAHELGTDDALTTKSDNATTNNEEEQANVTSDDSGRDVPRAERHLPESDVSATKEGSTDDMKQGEDDEEEEENDDDDDFGDFDEAEAIQITIQDIEFFQDMNTSLHKIIPGTFNPPQSTKKEESLLNHGDARKYNNILVSRNRQFIPSDINLKKVTNFYNKNYINDSSIHKLVGDVSKEWRSVEKGLLTEETSSLKNHSRKLFNWSSTKEREAKVEEAVSTSQFHPQPHTKVQINKRLLKAAATKARAIVDERTERERLHTLKLQREQRERVKRLELARQKREEMNKKYEAPTLENSDNKKTFLGRIFGKKSKIASDSFSHDKLQGEKSPEPEPTGEESDDDDFDFHAFAFSKTGTENNGIDEDEDDELDDLTGGEVFGYNQLVVDEAEVDQQEEDQNIDIFENETEEPAFMTPIPVSKIVSQLVSDKPLASGNQGLPSTESEQFDTNKSKSTETPSHEAASKEEKEERDDEEEEEDSDDEFDDFVASPIATPEPTNQQSNLDAQPKAFLGNLDSLLLGNHSIQPTDQLTNLQATPLTPNHVNKLDDEYLSDSVSSLNSTSINQSTSLQNNVDLASQNQHQAFKSPLSQETGSGATPLQNTTVDDADNDDDDWGDFEVAAPGQSIAPAAKQHVTPKKSMPSLPLSKPPSRMSSIKRIGRHQKFVDIDADADEDDDEDMDLPESLVPSATSMLNERTFHNTTVLRGGDSFSRSGSIHRTGSVKRSVNVPKNEPTEVNLIDL